MVAGHSFAIKNLDHAAASLFCGRVYVVVYDEAAPILAVVWPMLLAAGETGPALWLTERDPERELASPMAQAGEVRRALDTGRIKSFQWGGAPAPGLRRVLEELDYFGAAKGGLVVIDGAEWLFAGAGPGETDSIIAACWRWAEQNACALLLLCTRRAGRADPADALRQATQRLGGFARFRRSDDRLWWDVFHWFGAERTVAGRSFRLSERADGGMAVEEDDAPQAAPEPAVDEDAVFITRAALPGKQLPPTAWNITEDFDALGMAVATATAATIILHYDQATLLDTLTRALFGLRQLCGTRIKIVVREINVRMRYSQEQLLMRLGANLVVPAEVSFSRFSSLVAMIQGQIFSRPLDANYEATVSGVVAVPERGYLAPANFIEVVAMAMERVHLLDIQNVLIRLPLTPSLTPFDALRYCSMKRPGDLCTADGESVYIFLFACRESDIEFTLDRLFRLPVPELFEGEVRYLSPETIRQAMEELSARAAQGKLADLGPVLAAVSQKQPTAETKAAWAAGSDNLLHRRAPSPALRRPLSLRSARPIVASS